MRSLSFPNRFGPTRPTLARGGAFAALALATIGSAHALTIVPTYDATILANAAAKNTIDALISEYSARILDSTTVKVAFSNGGGLGSSNTAYTSVSYSNYITALTSHASTALDAPALAQLSSHPYTGVNTVNLTTANARTLGFSAATSSDSSITLNLSLCFTGHATAVSGKYDLYAVAAHELDEALGTSSGIQAFSSPTSADLFRYSGTNVRNFDTDTSKHVYFSVDGATNLVEYNHFGRTGGDWGDWIHHASPQVQDFSGTPGVVINPAANEYGPLDVVGYNVAPVPEPATLAAVGLGVIALARRRRR